eukprot:scaffold50470_cov63-Phaeocystis_antarctica.AAC.1
MTRRARTRMCATPQFRSSFSTLRTQTVAARLARRSWSIPSICPRRRLMVSLLRPTRTAMARSRWRSSKHSLPRLCATRTATRIPRRAPPRNSGLTMRATAPAAR